MKNAFGTEGEHSAAGYGWCRTGAVVESEIVFVVGGVLKSPNCFSGGCFEGFDDFRFAFAVKQDHFSTGNYWG